jgi:molybdate transport system regulatory protein
VLVCFAGLGERAKGLFVNPGMWELPVRQLHKQKGKPMTLYVKTKIWIENDDQELLFGKGKTELIELIEQEGSIAKAAEKIGMNYKKAWSHIKILQKNIAAELVLPQKGGGGSGGTGLTPAALQLARNYRRLQEDVESYANQRFNELFPADIPPAS